MYEGWAQYLKTQKTITNNSAIVFEKKPLINQSSSSWAGTSLFYKENTLCREKGLKL